MTIHLPLFQSLRNFSKSILVPPLSIHANHSCKKLTDKLRKRHFDDLCVFWANLNTTNPNTWIRHRIHQHHYANCSWLRLRPNQNMIPRFYDRSRLLIPNYLFSPTQFVTHDYNQHFWFNAIWRWTIFFQNKQIIPFGCSKQVAFIRKDTSKKESQKRYPLQNTRNSNINAFRL